MPFSGALVAAGAGMAPVWPCVSSGVYSNKSYNKIGRPSEISKPY